MQPGGEYFQGNFLFTSSPSGPTVSSTHFRWLSENRLRNNKLQPLLSLIIQIFIDTGSWEENRPQMLRAFRPAPINTHTSVNLDKPLDISKSHSLLQNGKRHGEPLLGGGEEEWEDAFRNGLRAWQP